jgi:hypothetical protein
MSLFCSKDVPCSAAPTRLWVQSLVRNVWSLADLRWLCLRVHYVCRCCSRIVHVFQHRRRVKQVCMPTVMHTASPICVWQLHFGCLNHFVLDTVFLLLAFTYALCSQWGLSCLVSEVFFWFLSPPAGAHTSWESSKEC